MSFQRLFDRVDAREPNVDQGAIRVGSRTAAVLRRLTTAVAVAAITLGGGAPAHAVDLPIAQTPLYLANAIDPSFLMAVDDSGSMQWEMLARNQDGELIWGRDGTAGAGSVYGFFENDGTLRDGGSTLRGDFLELFPYANRSTKRNAVAPLTNLGFSRSAAFNPAYYNPRETYAPWKRADGTSWESMDTAAEWTTAKVDPRVSTPRTFDLTSVNENTTEIIGSTTYVTNARMFNMRVGMTVPAGTRYFAYGNYDGAGNLQNADCAGVPGTRRTWQSQAAEFTLGESCLMGISYFPATYFLPTNTSPDGNTAGAVAANQFTYAVAVAATRGGPRPSTRPGNGTMYRYEIKAANYPTTAAYNAAMTNFANWFVYYRTRNLAMVAALTHSLSGIGAMRVGYFTINSGRNTAPDPDTYDAYTDVTMRDMDLTADKAALFTSMTALPADGGTPNRWAVGHLGEQFKRTDAGAPVLSACQINAGMLFTDGYSNQGGPTGISPDDSALGAPFQDAFANTMADAAAKYYAESLRPDLAQDQVAVSSACSGTNPPRSLDCRNDPHMNFYGITLGALGSRYGTAPYIDNPATSDDEARAAAYLIPPVWEARQDDSLRAVDEIWHATMNSRGKYINASSPAAITSAMNEVLTSVIDMARKSGGTAASGARRNAGFLAYVPEYNSGDWTGDLAAFKLRPDGGLGTQEWSANQRLPLPGARNIFVSVPNGSSLELKTFEKANLGSTDVLAAAALGFGATDFSTRYPGATIDDAIAYLRGDDTKAQPAAGGVFRERSRKLGDILNSQPDVLSRGSAAFTDLSAAEGGDTYAAFVNTTKATRTPLVFVGTNGGMIHAFDGRTGTQGGREIFSIIPNGVLNDMHELVNPSYRHRYYVDASPTTGDAYLNGVWKTVLVSGHGGGGKSIIALDVTDPVSSFTAGNLLWEYPGPTTVDNDLGLTYGRPKIVLLEDGEWYAAFGNGYNSVSQAATLYLVQLDDVTNVIKIQAAAGDVANPNGLNTVLAVDKDKNNLVDRIYASDYRGKLWEFDLSAAAPGSWGLGNGGAPLFIARYADATAQNITGSLSVARHPLGGLVVYFGSGRYLLTGDSVVVATPKVETFYAIWDNDIAGTVATSALQQQNITTEVAFAGGVARKTTERPVDFSTKRGWFINLKVDDQTSGMGERFIGEPQVVLGRAIFVTFTPLGTACAPGGRNILYSLDAITGSNFITLGSTCANCGGVVLTNTGGSDAPAVAPPIVIDPKAPPPAAPCSGPSCPPPCAPGDLSCQPCASGDPTCDPNPDTCIPGRDENCPASGKRSSECNNNVSVLLANQGLTAFSTVSCGRQSWRQIR